MILIAGLGNPGRRYAATKHNFGFWVVDAFARQRELNFRAGKGDYVYTRHGTEFMLLKPTTYMNSSGLAVSEACRYFNIPPEQILLVYDDIDLPLGKLRFRSAGGTGGHRGVESVIYHLQTDNFARLRLGIATEEPMRPAETYVLQPFPKGTEEQVSAVINTAVEGLDYFLTHGITATMNQYN